jgi:flavin reductase
MLKHASSSGDGRLRRILAASVTVVTTRGEYLHGVTATAVASVSHEPPLMLVCMRSGGGGAEAIQRNGRFAVNVLGADQEALSRRFASPRRPRGTQAFMGVQYRLSRVGSPLLEGVAGYADCVLSASHAAGDHVILVGEIKDLHVNPELEPLLSHGGEYRRLADD